MKTKFMTMEEKWCVFVSMWVNVMVVRFCKYNLEGKHLFFPYSLGKLNLRSDVHFFKSIHIFLRHDEAKIFSHLDKIKHVCKVE